MSEHCLTLTHENFPQFTGGSELVLVDFWAPWCGPCKMLGPILEEYAQGASSIKVGKVNVDDHGEISSQYGIRGIPTLMLFKDGKVVATKVGMLSLAQLSAWVSENQ